MPQHWQKTAEYRQLFDGGRCDITPCNKNSLKIDRIGRNMLDGVAGSCKNWLMFNRSMESA